MPSFLQFTFRKNVLCVFLVGFAPPLNFPVNDKIQHFCVFFVLTLVFYWIFDLSRRRAAQLTFIVCFLLGALGSEFIQSFLSYRTFDVYDIAADWVGSSVALMLDSLYHKRRLEKLRTLRYGPVPTEQDLEMQVAAAAEQEESEETTERPTD
ncbi:VanZ-like family protein [Schizosaccharomyces japonicus yFS275]|uniref:VanZ-like family protein n=1 Tax=Schizosaccharomyces japonicus (strain yFS275 / FY16936) TaxID=402676 RepID=B6JV15_SCHJY|nr:VanZ-like family protein [Schizosaccharomyces japonicus yFS275]EEB05216.1 VanZ-like family protein [Schizosaccharomyces japonicus yFS275]